MKRHEPLFLPCCPPCWVPQNEGLLLAGPKKSLYAPSGLLTLQHQEQNGSKHTHITHNLFQNNHSGLDSWFLRLRVFFILIALQVNLQNTAQKFTKLRPLKL